MSAWPSLIVRADFTTPALQIPTDWTDLSDRVRSVNIHQGRNRLLGHTETGRATVRMDNRDRALDPSFNPGASEFFDDGDIMFDEAGTFFEGAGVPLGIRPGVHLQIQTVVGTQTIDLFRGYVRSWGQEWPGKKDAVSEVQAEDAFTLLSRYELTGDAIAQMTAGEHLETVLLAYGWPAPGSIPPGKTWWQLGHAGSALGTNTFLGEQTSFFDDGHSTIMATTLEGNLLVHLLNVAETTERGTFYVGPSGDLIFNQRPTAHVPPIGTWGDEGAELRYVDLTMAYNDEEIYNDIRLTRRGDTTPSTATDATSIESYGPRTLAQDDLLFSDTGQQATAAQELAAQFKEPVLHPVQMAMRPPYTSPLWLATLGVELGSKITVKRRPPGGGDPIEIDCLILGVTHNITPSQWDITWDLAPAVEVVRNGWYLGVVGSSELGTTTILA